MEKIVETKICNKCNKNFDITDKDIEFYSKISPKIKGKKYLIGTPKDCPECRMQKRILWRNERCLYKIKCNKTNENIISMYKPDNGYTVYNQNFWLSDKWNASDYGVEYNANSSFFKQFGKLYKSVPKSSLVNFNVENCDYTNFQNDSKGCYLTFGSGFLEDSMFTNWTYYGNNILDASFCSNIEIGYMLIDCDNCYHTFFSKNCSDSKYLYYCLDTKGCSYCFGSTGLRNKKYYFLNKEYTKDQYEKKLNIFFESTLNEKKEIHKQIDDIFLKHPKKNLIINESENCNGDYISNGKNCNFCFDLQSGEDSKYCTDVLQIKDFYDSNKTGIGELYYGVCGGGYYNNVGFILMGTNLTNCYYMIECINCKNCFGCVGLKDKEYYILNKKYTKDQYEELLSKILTKLQNTGEWGEFFPPSISPFGYNETIAQEYFPLKKEDAIRKGFNWSDYKIPLSKVEKIIPANKLPDDISKIPDDILNWAIKCEDSEKLFIITPMELKFYRKYKISIPRKHPDQRHLERINKRNPRKLFDRNCDKCGKKIKTTYSQDKKDIIYCEECYNKFIY